MDVPSRLRELLPIWSWLPAFRAVAETEHLPSAAEMCGVGPSSLSRSLSLIERHLNKPLFTRSGRNLTLNDDGRCLLAAVRDAMRRVDDGLEELRGDGLRGSVAIGSSGAGTTALVAPAIERLRSEHPDLMPMLLTRSPDKAPADLLSGKLDVAFQEVSVQHRSLVTRVVGNLGRSVYCGRRHPLYLAEELTTAALQEAEFVTPPAGTDGVAPDGWPAELERKVALIVDQLRVGLELCVDQPLLAVLPDVLAETRGKDLRRLGTVPIPATPVYAIYRTVLGLKPSAAVALAEIVLAG